MIYWLRCLYNANTSTDTGLKPMPSVVEGRRSDEGPMLETLDYTIRIGSTPTFLYFDEYIRLYKEAYLLPKLLLFSFLCFLRHTFRLS